MGNNNFMGKLNAAVDWWQLRGWKVIMTLWGN